MIKKIIIIALFFTSIFNFSQVGFDEHSIVNQSSTTRFIYSCEYVDLDNDGDEDILLSSEDNLIWYKNIDGNDLFGNAIIIKSCLENGYSYQAGVSTYGDLDNDGDQDVIAIFNSEKLVWFENLDGNGNFNSYEILSDLYLSNSRNIKLKDIDNDGDLDIFLVYNQGNHLAWFKNNNGNFIFIPLATNSDYFKKNLKIEDFDGDNDLDVIMASYWYENTDGLGNFIQHSYIGNDIFELADVDSDGDLDTFFGSNDINFDISFFKNVNGELIFQYKIDNTSNIKSIEKFDVDSDGDLDLIIYGDLSIKWVENENGNFNNVYPIFETTEDIEFISYKKSNNNDSINFIITSILNYDAGKVWNLKYTIQGESVLQQLLTRFVHQTKITATDLNGNGDKEIFICGNYLFGFIKKTSNDYSSLNLIPGSMYREFYENSFQDIDNDGDIDILIKTYQNSIGWLKNNGENFEYNEISSEYLNYFTPVDIDNDNDIDIFEIRNNYSELVLFENSGNNTWSRTTIIEQNKFHKVIFIDVDNDGDKDLIALTEFPDEEISWFENIDGQGNFGDEQIISTTIHPPKILSSGDFNNDGKMDFIVGEQYRILWFKNVDGQGNWESEVITSVNNDIISSISVTDLDSDGDLDVIFTSINQNKLAWVENTDGLGGFGNQQIISDNFDGAYYLYATDYDNDSDIDLLVTSKNDRSIKWFENLGSTSNYINGHVRFDVDSNGCDESFLPIKNILVTTSNDTEEISTFTRYNGTYQFFPDEGEYTTSIVSPFNNYYTVTPNFASSSFTGLGNTDKIDFCIEPMLGINDLNISLIPTRQARPGFDITYKLVYKNVGTTQLSGNITLEFDDTKLNFLNASNTINTQTSNSLSFDYLNLNPFETKIINIKFNVFSPPTVNINDVLNFTATITPITGDETENDNTFILNQTVIGSFDPNDITCLEGDEITITDADKYLHYVIRFQNTGNASAINVKVLNTLDDKLDWSTLQIENLSHENRIVIKNGNEIEFLFENINLPDSTTNEPNSHGFIAYKIKPKENIIVGDIISNKADIIFDFNTPIETNTVTTEITNALTENDNTLQNFSVYPIPTENILNIKSKTEITKIEIYSKLGQLLIETTGNKIDISNLTQDLYFILVTDVNGYSGVKKILKK